MKARTIMTLITISFLVSQGIYADDLTPEWVYDGKLTVMNDMDDDGVYELISGYDTSATKSIYDGATPHNLKWTITGMDLCPNFKIKEGYLFSSFDINGDGIGELVGDSGDYMVVYDVAQDLIIHRIDGTGATYEYAEFNYWGDIDNNGIDAELIIEYFYYTDWKFDSTRTKIYSIPIEPFSVESNVDIMPSGNRLTQNYPNPFNPTTIIGYQVQSAGHVKLSVYNTLGQRVNTLVDEDRGVGEYSVQWNGKNESGDSAASGIYFYQLEIGDFVSSKKMVIIK